MCLFRNNGYAAGYVCSIFSPFFFFWGGEGVSLHVCSLSFFHIKVLLFGTVVLAHWTVINITHVNMIMTIVNKMGYSGFSKDHVTDITQAENNRHPDTVGHIRSQSVAHI